MFFRLLKSFIICGIGLGISDYFKFQPYMYFIMGGISYGIYDIISDLKLKVKLEKDKI